MIRSTNLLLALPLTALIFSSVACTQDDTLSATETIQAIYRARWAGDMLDRALQATAPLSAMPAQASLEEAETHLADLYDGCATLLREDDTLHVRVEESCATPAYPCIGTYDLTKLPAGNGVIAVDGFKIIPDALTCGEQALAGTVELQQLPVSEGQPYPWLLSVEGLEHSDAREIDGEWVQFAAASDFHGDFYVQAHSISTPSKDTLSLMVLAGQGTFTDVELGLDWEVDAMDLGMSLGMATLRAGDLQLRSTPGSRYVFQTSWVALSATATRVTVRKDKQQWIGCISDGDAKECQELGY